MNSKTRAALKALLYMQHYGASKQTAGRVISMSILKGREPSSSSLVYDASSKTILRGEQ